MPYRLIYAGLGLVAVAAVALGIVLSTEGEEIVLPGALEDVWKALHGAVIRAGGGAVGHTAAEELRVEAGQAAWGPDWE